MDPFKQAYDSAIEQMTGQPGSPFEIAEREIDGVSYRMFVNAPENICELLAPAREFGDRDFVIYEGEHWSFDAYFNTSDRLAYQLREKYSARKGVRIAIAMRNYPEWLVAWMAIVSTGATVVPINSLGSSEELAYNLEDSGAELVFCDHQRCKLIDFDNTVVHAIVARPQGALPDGNCIALDTLLEAAPAIDALPEANISIAPDDVAMIMYTSGTSGRPKGAVFTHRSICQAIISLDLTGAVAYLTNQETFNQHLQKQLPSKSLVPVPLFHVSGMYSQFLLNLRGGRAIVLTYKWDIPAVCKLIDNERITSIVGAPSMLIDLLESPEFASIDSSSLMNISAGGAASPQRLSDLRNERTPDAMPGAGWGLTESGGIGASFTGAAARAKPQASGFLHALVELRFCDEDGNEVEPGSPGELWIKSPTNVTGYWKRPEDNASEFQLGWFRTGDIGYIGEDGCLNICDRAKDMVIRKGENIYPVEIENCILSMPGIETVAAFAVPSETMGEELAVVARPRKDADTIDEAAVKQYCAAHLASFKVPSFVKFTDQPFPLNASNKVLKKAVREQYFPQA